MATKKKKPKQRPSATKAFNNYLLRVWLSQQELTPWAQELLSVGWTAGVKWARSPASGGAVDG